MDVGNEDIRNTGNEVSTGVTSCPQGSNQAAYDCWYIFRYMVLNKRAKEYFQENTDKVFYPLRKVRRNHEGADQGIYVEQPIVPGYIFVHAKLSEAIAMGKEVDMSLWKKRLDSSEPAAMASTLSERKAQEARGYYSIKDSAMRQFIRAVEISTQDFKLLDASCIDLAKDDLVEIIAGDFTGYKGYLKSVNGSNGGLVIVPLEAEGGQALPPHSLFNYGIPTSSSQIAILAFAKGSRRATDLLNRACKVVDKVMEAYMNGEKITGQQETRIMGYVHRFGQVKLDTPAQRVRLSLMLYRIYTILGLSAERESIRRQLTDEILPQCRHRKDNARKCNKATAENTYQEYEDKMRETDDATDRRQKAMREKRHR